MKKKLLSILLALVLVFGMMTFAGCGKGDPEKFFSVDNTMQLTLQDDEYTLVQKTAYGYFEKTLTISGNFIEHGKFVEFLPGTGKTKTNFFDKSTNERNTKHRSFYGERSSENGIVLSLTNANSKEGNEPLFKNGYETGIYSVNALSNHACCDIVVSKNCSVETLAEKIKYLRVLTQYGSSAYLRTVDENSIKGFNPSATGSQTVKFDYGDTQYEIVVFVDNNQNYLVNDHELRTSHILANTVKLGTTAEQWLEKSEQLSLEKVPDLGPLKFYAYVDGNRIEFDKDEVSVEGWKADRTNDRINFIPKITAKKDGEEFVTFGYVNTFDEDVTYTTINLYNPPIRNHIGDDSPNTSTSKYDFNYLAIDKSKNMQIDINIVKPVESLFSDNTLVSSTPGQISDLINLDQTGAQILTLNENTPFEQNFFIYVYDENTTVASDYYYIPLNAIPVIDGELLLSNEHMTLPVMIGMDGQFVEFVDKNKLTVNYNQDELSQLGHARVTISFCVTVDGKEYTFKYITGAYLVEG